MIGRLSLALYKTLFVTVKHCRALKLDSLCIAFDIDLPPEISFLSKPAIILYQIYMTIVQ